MRQNPETRPEGLGGVARMAGSLFPERKSVVPTFAFETTNCDCDVGFQDEQRLEIGG
jgi:hypothetical protein